MIITTETDKERIETIMENITTDESMVIIRNALEFYFKEGNK